MPRRLKPGRFNIIFDLEIEKKVTAPILKKALSLVYRITLNS
jgi:hypothetical protein